MMSNTEEVCFTRLTGLQVALSLILSYASPYRIPDIILKVAGILTVKGGTVEIIEYFGLGVSTISSFGVKIYPQYISFSCIFI